ncbi:hypothetical protein EDD21DRAFT_95302 [Dissophora ornata]|nr:hypothetical protein EDD21DRAFT_95302 [Dissophora ornata]
MVRTRLFIYCIVGHHPTNKKLTWTLLQECGFLLVGKTARHATTGCVIFLFAGSFQNCEGKYSSYLLSPTRCLFPFASVFVSFTLQNFFSCFFSFSMLFFNHFIFQKPAPFLLLHLLHARSFFCLPRIQLVTFVFLLEPFFLLVGEVCFLRERC